MELYDGHTVATQLGIPYRTLMYWVETGLVRPHTYSKSSKNRRPSVLFSDKDVVEIGRLAQLRRYLRGQSLRDVLNRLREMGHNPLSQGDFLVLENHKGQRNVIKILHNNEAIQLLRTQPDSQLRLIPLTGDEVQETILTVQQSDDPNASSEGNAVLDDSPIALLFDVDQFTPVEISEIISLLSEIYHDVGGDALVIDELALLDPTSIMTEV